MNLSSSVQLSQKQLVVLAPALRKALNMLAMNLPQLHAELNNEIAKNPVIDDVERALETETISQKEREREQIECFEMGDYPYDDSEPDPSYAADADAIERRQKFFDSQKDEETLESHLLSQIATSDIGKNDVPLAEMLVGELNEDGYFSGSIPDLIMVTGESEDKIHEVLNVIKTFDPPGCGALSLEDCLLAQIDKLDSSPYQDEVREILENKLLSDIANGNIALVEKTLGVTHERYADVLRALRSLDPRPARAFSRSGKRIAYINPEVHAVNVSGKWIATVDSRSLPEIKISQRYLKMLSDPSVDEEAKEYIRKKIASANELSEALKNREQTVLSVSQAILDSQPGFFESGLKGLRPLAMKEIADKTSVHISTISRTVNDKYISTPRGTVELRRFFVAGCSTDDGENVVKDVVFDALKNIISSENRSKPLSDDKIATALKEKGFSVARRTVAKYRSRLGIPGVTERRSNLSSD